MKVIGNQCVGVRSDSFRCRSTGAYYINGIPFCDPHYRELALHFGADPSVYGLTDTPGVVYYIGDPDSQHVKIGVTTRLHQRFREVTANRPNSKLLAVEPGYMDLERLRHRQFAATRVTGNPSREWFLKTDELMAHIGEVRNRHGDPWEFNPYTRIGKR